VAQLLAGGERVYFQAIPIYARPGNPRYKELGEAPIYVQYPYSYKNEGL